MRIRVFLAGPISKGDLHANIQQAREAFVRLMRAGFSPLCPHLSAYLEDDTPRALPCDTTIEEWYAWSLDIMAGCHILLRLPGESVGSDLEMQEAIRLGMPIYTDLDRLIETHGIPTAEVDSGAKCQ